MMITIIILISLSSFLSISDTASSKADINVLQEINAKVQDSIDKLFTILPLNKDFSNSLKNKLLLSTHEIIKILAEKRIEAYKDIVELVKLCSKIKSNNTLFDLDKLVKILVEEKLVPINVTLSNNGSDTDEVKFHNFLLHYLYRTNADSVSSERLGVDFPMEMKNLFKKISVNRWQGNNQEMTRRLFQGEVGAIRRFSFVVSIHIMEDFTCAGSAISRTMVITAATCLQSFYTNVTSIVNKDDLEGLIIRAGSSHTKQNGEVYTASKIYFHPQFVPVTLRNNIAIIQLEYPFHRKLRRIEYRKWGKIRPHDYQSKIKNILVIGWGDEDFDSTADSLTYSKLQVTSLQKCKTVYSGTFITKNNFCAGQKLTRVGACQRDVGGPAIGNSRLIGVISFGPPVCGTYNEPTVFTNVARYISWIDCVVQTEDICETKKLQNVTKKFKIKRRTNQLKNINPSSQSGDIMLKQGVDGETSEYDKKIKVTRNILKILDVNEMDFVKRSKSMKTTTKPEEKNKFTISRRRFAPLRWMNFRVSEDPVISLQKTKKVKHIFPPDYVSGQSNPIHDNKMFSAVDTLKQYLGLGRIFNVTEVIFTARPIHSSITKLQAPQGNNNPPKVTSNRAQAQRTSGSTPRHSKSSKTSLSTGAYVSLDEIFDNYFFSDINDDSSEETQNKPKTTYNNSRIVEKQKMQSTTHSYTPYETTTKNNQTTKQISSKVKLNEILYVKDLKINTTTRELKSQTTTRMQVNTDIKNINIGKERKHNDHQVVQKAHKVIHKARTTTPVSIEINLKNIARQLLNEDIGDDNHYIDIQIKRTSRIPIKINLRDIASKFFNINTKTDEIDSSKTSEETRTSQTIVTTSKTHKYKNQEKNKHRFKSYSNLDTITRGSYSNLDTLTRGSLNWKTSKVNITTTKKNEETISVTKNIQTGPFFAQKESKKRDFFDYIDEETSDVSAPILTDAYDSRRKHSKIDLASFLSEFALF